MENEKNGVSALEFLQYLLYYTGENPKIVESLEISKLINVDRKILPKFNAEIDFIEKFKFPKFLIIVDKLIHVYLIGEEINKMKAHVVEIIGHDLNKYEVSTAELIKIIRKNLNNDKDLYLPMSFYRKVIFISPNYSTRTELTDDEVTVFSKNDVVRNFMDLGSWSAKIEDYSLDDREDFKAHTVEILRYLLNDKKWLYFFEILM